jgi:hypothetical protein
MRWLITVAVVAIPPYHVWNMPPKPKQTTAQIKDDDFIRTGRTRDNTVIRWDGTSERACIVSGRKPHHTAPDCGSITVR